MSAERLKKNAAAAEAKASELAAEVPSLEIVPRPLPLLIHILVAAAYHSHPSSSRSHSQVAYLEKCRVHGWAPPAHERHKPSAGAAAAVAAAAADARAVAAAETAHEGDRFLDRQKQRLSSGLPPPMAGPSQAAAQAAAAAQAEARAAAHAAQAADVSSRARDLLGSDRNYAEYATGSAEPRSGAPAAEPPGSRSSARSGRLKPKVISFDDGWSFADDEHSQVHGALAHRPRRRLAAASYGSAPCVPSSKALPSPPSPQLSEGFASDEPSHLADGPYTNLRERDAYERATCDAAAQQQRQAAEAKALAEAEAAVAAEAESHARAQLEQRHAAEPEVTAAAVARLRHPTAELASPSKSRGGFRARLSLLAAVLFHRPSRCLPRLRRCCSPTATSCAWRSTPTRARRCRRIGTPTARWGTPSAPAGGRLLLDPAGGF